MQFELNRDNCVEDTRGTVGEKGKCWYMKIETSSRKHKKIQWSVATKNGTEEKSAANGTDLLKN